MRILLDFDRIAVTNRVVFKIREVENLVTEIGFDYNVNVEIDVIEDTPVKTRRHAHVAIEFLKLALAIAIAEAKDVEPAIEPIVFSTDRSRSNLAEQIVFYVFTENSVENQQWPGLLNYAGGPPSMFRAVVFIYADFNSYIKFTHFLPLLAQSARNCACPFSVNGWLKS